MTTNMLDYCKIILEKVSFDPKLFRKEYKKSLKFLSNKDQMELKKWLRENLPDQTLKQVSIK